MSISDLDAIGGTPTPQQAVWRGSTIHDNPPAHEQVRCELTARRGRQIITGVPGAAPRRGVLACGNPPTPGVFRMNVKAKGLREKQFVSVSF